MQYGFVLDHRKCIGCHACTVACKSENDVPVGDFRTWVKYTEIGTFPTIKRHFAVLRCNHCTKAPCVTICPVNALDKRVDGIVDLDRDACIGCKACMQACPYDAIYLNEDTGGAEKCHYCAHRVEQGLQPACVVVCPEEAIIAGDLHEPESQIAQLAALPEAVVRRPEQGTEPNVHYLGIDPVSLHPGRAAEPDTYIWSDRRLPAPDYPEQHDFPVTPDARTVLDVNHKVHWGPMVSAYLVTKGVAAGAALLAPVAAQLGLTGFGANWAPEILALVFTSITTLLLVGDLKRPMLFFRLITRPNTKSWLVKGGWILMAFSTLTALILALRLFGAVEAAEMLRWPNAVLGSLTAIYTALLFAQCEGRDLWQKPEKLSVHLTVQAMMCGGLALLPFIDDMPSHRVALIVVLTAGAHTVLALLGLRGNKTENAQQAASLLPRIPVFRDGKLPAFGFGLLLTLAVALFVFLTSHIESLHGTPTGSAMLIVLGSLGLVGLFLYEQAYIRAGQIPPLS